MPSEIGELLEVIAVAITSRHARATLKKRSPLVNTQLA
jgi:hypothetical protein